MAAQTREDLLGRKRQIDIEKLADDQAEQLAKQIGEKIAKEINETAEKCRKILKIYGLDVKMTYLIHKIGENPLAELSAAKPSDETQKSQKKRGRPKKEPK